MCSLQDMYDGNEHKLTSPKSSLCEQNIQPSGTTNLY